MNELAKHIETLLLENDCVIVPNLGGFVGHYAPASLQSEENRFLPPTRIIGFNPSLKMNDGLFVQSYASVYGTSFSDANRRVEAQVKQLLDCLYQEGKAELPNIGELHYSIYGTFSFKPYDNRLTTPYLYGLSSFEMRRLSLPKQTVSPVHRMSSPSVPTTHRQHRPLRIEIPASYVRNAVGMVAALILFFLISTPIENTGVMEENYAHMIPSEWFNQLKQSSLVTTPVKVIRTKEIKVKQLETKAKHSVVAANSKPIVKESAMKHSTATATVGPSKVGTTKSAVSTKTAVSTTADTAAKKTASPKVVSANKVINQNVDKKQIAPTTKPYYIIIASVSTERDARNMAEQLQRKGYPQASAVIGDGKMRVSIQSYTNQAEAYKGLKKIRAIESYQSAWILH
ncbi:protein containing Sporulation/cell division region, bacteria domain protein [gut metagenome]|uniref:Protein containing Sporulation/cell division region, bacteria domain protein n=1 Tax=gut metagenome TaxID=749906 RepID=J9G2X3_9ZZZZ